jgi:predicted RNase H-like HicB family nuclease
MTKRAFTAIYKKRGDHYVAWIEEIPGVNTQGKTKQEAKENLKEALLLILRVNRQFAKKEHSRFTTREVLRVVMAA